MLGVEMIVELEVVWVIVVVAIVVVVVVVGVHCHCYWCYCLSCGCLGMAEKLGALCSLLLLFFIFSPLHVVCSLPSLPCIDLLFKSILIKECKNAKT